MTRGEMRDLLARYLNDASHDVWSPTELNALLNLGLIDIQSFVEATEPDAFLFIDQRDIVLGNRYYSKPVGITSERSLKFSSNPASTEYAKLEVTSYELIEQGMVSKPSYAHFGRYFYLSWIPAANVTNGLQVVWSPTLAMSEDTDVPDVHMRLHYAVVLAAAVKGLRETPDDAKVFQEDLAIELRKIPLLYLKSAAGNLPLNIDMDQRY